MVEQSRHQWLQQRPQTIFWFICAFLIVSGLIVIVVDVFNLFGLGDWWADRSVFPFFWMTWWDIPVERPLQWVMLAAVVMLFFRVSGLATELGDEELVGFSRTLGVGTLLMFMEDTVDIRHRIRVLIDGGDEATTYALFGTFFELGYFAALATVLLYAFVRYHSLFWPRGRLRRSMLTAYGCYAMAVGSSWLGSAFRDVTDGDDLYTVVGDAITALLFDRTTPVADRYQWASELLAEGEAHSLGFLFMDQVYEESLELLGAAAFLVAALTIYFDCRNNDDSLDSR